MRLATKVAIFGDFRANHIFKDFKNLILEGKMILDTLEQRSS